MWLGGDNKESYKFLLKGKETFHCDTIRSTYSFFKVSCLIAEIFESHLTHMKTWETETKMSNLRYFFERNTLSHLTSLPMTLFTLKILFQKQNFVIFPNPESCKLYPTEEIFLNAPPPRGAMYLNNGRMLHCILSR